MNSLERRFVLGLTVTLLWVFGLLFWGAVTAVQQLSEAYVLTRLEHDAHALLAAMRVTPRGQLRLREGRITPIYQQPLSGHYFVLDLADGTRVRSRSLWDESLSVSAVGVGEVATYRAKGPGTQRLLLRTAGYEKGRLGFTLTVAEDLAPLFENIRQFQYFAFGVLFFSLVAILLIQQFILRRGFRTLDQVRDELFKVSTGQLQRLKTPGPAEISPLTGEINRLLQQLQRRLQRSRQAMGNLAHGLKAPLSLVTREVDAMQLATTDRQRLNGQLERIGALIERELKRARLAGEGSGQHFEPRRQIAELLDALRQLYRERALEIRCSSLPPGTLPVDQEDMLELLGNLLDNACKWARHRVDLRMSIDEELRITVSDDGEGVAAEKLDTLLHRGSRIDEREAGHGLGLAIVNDLVGEYGGSIALRRSGDLGGLEVQVNLPLPHPVDRSEL